MARCKRFLPILALLLLLPFVVHAEEPIRKEEGVVGHVADGDTVHSDLGWSNVSSHN